MKPFNEVLGYVRNENNPDELIPAQEADFDDAVSVSSDAFMQPVDRKEMKSK